MHALRFPLRSSRFVHAEDLRGTGRYRHQLHVLTTAPIENEWLPVVGCDDLTAQKRLAISHPAKAKYERMVRSTNSGELGSLT